MGRNEADGKHGALMRRATILALALTAVVTPLRSGPAGAKEPHEIKLKHPICEDTYIVGINSRLFGSAVNYANGKYGVSYEYVPELSERAQAGDKVRARAYYERLAALAYLGNSKREELKQAKAFLAEQ